MNATAVNQQIDQLIDRWCERRALFPLSVLLPAHLANNGLTDGWADLAAALRALADSPKLLAAEGTQCKQLYVTIDQAVRNR